MDCPKCHNKIDEGDCTCPYCGTRIKPEPEKKRVIAVKPKRKKEKKGKKDDPQDNNAKTTEQALAKKRSIGQILKLAAIAVCAAVVIVLVIVVVNSVISSKGEKYAQTAAEYIGKELSELESDEQITFKDESAYYGVNSAVEFDYIFESDSDTEANGVSYPEWAVLVEVSDVNYIQSVRYVDFTVLSKDIRGVKNDKLITLDSFAAGEKQSNVTKTIDMDPYSVEYTQKGTVIYTYRYYYERDNTDEQQVILRVAFNGNKKYKYYTSELVYPYDL